MAKLRLMDDAETIFLPASVLPAPLPVGYGLFNEKNEMAYQATSYMWGDNEQGTEVLWLELKKKGAAQIGSELEIRKAGWSVAAVTLSDKGSKGLRVDESGPLIQQTLAGSIQPVFSKSFLIPDNAGELKALLCHLALLECYDLVITTGGTGVGERDITPQVTNSLLDLPMPGIPAAMLMSSLAKTPNAIISRAAAGLLGKCLVINLPGSKKAVAENLEAILPGLAHTLAKINGDTSDCGGAL